jgi:hypothetical protein
MKKPVLIAIITLLCALLIAPAALAQDADGDLSATEEAGSGGNGFALTFGVQRNQSLGASSALSYSGFSGRLDGELRLGALRFPAFFLGIPLGLTAGMERPSQFEFVSILTLNPEAGIRIMLPAGELFKVGAGLGAGAYIYLIERLPGAGAGDGAYVDMSLRFELIGELANLPRRSSSPRIGVRLIPGYQINFENPKPVQRFTFAILNSISWGEQ